MLSFLSKIGPLLMYPVGLAGLCGVASGIAILKNKRKAAMALAFLSAAVLWFFSCPVVTHVLVRSLESKFDAPVSLPKVPAIVLLGGCTKPAVRPRTTVEVSCAGDRILHAARLLKQGYAPVIIATGGKLAFVYDFPGSEARCMASILRDDCGVDSSAIIIENKAENTHDNALNVEKILQARGMKKEIILVTSAMHMYRSVKIFRKRGCVVYPSAADFRADAAFQWNLFSFVPSVEALFESSNALHEYYGIIAYSILGWM